MGINTVRLCVDKYIAGGTDSVLFDKQRKSCPAEIIDDVKSWIINIICQKPCELWTITTLHKYICRNAEAAGYPRLTTVTKPYIQTRIKSEASGSK